MISLAISLPGLTNEALGFQVHVNAFASVFIRSAFIIVTVVVFRNTNSACGGEELGSVETESVTVAQTVATGA